jgi:hypothetical protein
MVIKMIWKIQAIYRIAYRAKQNSGKYSRRSKRNPSFDDMFNKALLSTADSKLASHVAKKQ